jgi:hypothetical protein
MTEVDDLVATADIGNPHFNQKRHAFATQVRIFPKSRTRISYYRKG